MGSVLVTWPQRVLVIGAFLLFHVTQLNAQATSREEEILQQRTDKRARLWPERTSGIVKLFDKYTETRFARRRSIEQGQERDPVPARRHAVGQRHVRLVLATGESICGARNLRSALRLVERCGKPTCSTRRSTSPGSPPAPRRAACLCEVRKLAANGLLRSRTRLPQGRPHQLPAGGYQHRLERPLPRMEGTLVGLHRRFLRAEHRTRKTRAASLRLKRSLLLTRHPVLTINRTFCGRALRCSTTTVTCRPVRAQGGIITFTSGATGIKTSGGTPSTAGIRRWNNTSHTGTRPASWLCVWPWLPRKPGKGRPFRFTWSPRSAATNSCEGLNVTGSMTRARCWLTVEHRWHLFSGGHAAIFAEAGKVAPKATQLNLARAKYAGGIGFRFTLRDAVIMRLDNAISNEGYRFMWTFSNMW